MTKRQKRLREWDLMSEENVGFHDSADIFPPMSDVEFQALKEDILEHGLQSPIMTNPEGKIIDGRHRWRACMETKTEPRYQVYRGNPWVYVVSANLHRRHLTDTQRAMVAARLAKRASGVRGADKETILKGAADAAPFKINQQPSRADAAALLHVNEGAIERARRVLVYGIPELATVVEDSKVPMSTAARVALTLDKDEQLEYVEKIKRGEDPVKVAPPSAQWHNSPKRNRRIRPVGKDTLTLDHVNNIGSAMVGIDTAFGGVTTLDSEVTPEAARRLLREINRAYPALRILKRLLNIRAKED